jgi:hypothetical protein
MKHATPRRVPPDQDAIYSWKKSTMPKDSTMRAAKTDSTSLRTDGFLDASASASLYFASVSRALPTRLVAPNLLIGQPLDFVSQHFWQLQVERFKSFHRTTLQTVETACAMPCSSAEPAPAPLFAEASRRDCHAATLLSRSWHFRVYGRLSCGSLHVLQLLNSRTVSHIASRELD